MKTNGMKSYVFFDSQKIVKAKPPLPGVSKYFA